MEHRADLARVLSLAPDDPRAEPWLAFAPVVAIPARNEEALLPRMIAALARQSVLSWRPAPLEVVIVLNNTDDGSREVIASAARRAPGLKILLRDVVYSADRAHVGSARRMAMRVAGALRPGGVILTTDADAVPADDWIDSGHSPL